VAASVGEVCWEEEARLGLEAALALDAAGVVEQLASSTRARAQMSTARLRGR
jgi:hypothetical protein